MNIHGLFFIFMNFMTFLVFCFTITYGAVYRKTLKKDKKMFDFYVRQNSFVKLFKYEIVLPIFFVLFNYTMLLSENDDLIRIPLFRIFFNI